MMRTFENSIIVSENLSMRFIWVTFTLQSEIKSAYMITLKMSSALEIPKFKNVYLVSWLLFKIITNKSILARDDDSLKR